MRTVEYLNQIIKSGNSFKSAVTKFGKKAEFYLVFLFTSFLVISTFSTATAQEGYIDVTETLQDTYEQAGDQANARDLNSYTSGVGALSSNITAAGCGIVFPTLCVDPAMAANSDVSPAVRKGLVGLLDDTTAGLIASQPSLNVNQLMASEWIPGYDEAQNAAYAGGAEFLTSTGINRLSEISRNLSYLIYIVVLIAAGFMIMFRNKIGGQVAVTIFNTIPNVIISLLMTTFSFAIAGLILNISAAATNVIGSILTNTFQVNAADTHVTNPFSLFKFGYYALDGFGQVLGDMLGGTGIGAAFEEMLALGAIGGILGLIVAGPAGLLFGAIAGIIVLLFVFIIAAIASVRVYITLLKAYLAIIFDVFLGPLVNALAAIPGRTGMRMDWIFRLLKNGLVFSCVSGVVGLSVIIATNTDVNITDFTPLVNGTLTPLNAAQTTGAIAGVLKGAASIYLLFLAAEVPNFLADIFPSNSGKGSATAMQSAQANLSKTPFVGDFFRR